MRIRHGQPSDFTALMDRVHASFSDDNPTHPRFETLCPDSISADPACVAQWLIADVDGEIAAGLQIVPRSVVVARDVQLPVGGIANVFCYPAFRNRGCMTALLEEAETELETAGYALSMLGGDRLRYGRHGWEHAGAARRLGLSAAMKRDQDLLRVSAADLALWHGDQDLATQMAARYGELPCRTLRSAAEFPAVLTRPGQSVWTCSSDQDGFGYISLKGNLLAEYAGDAAAVEKLLRFVLRSRTVDVVIPPAAAESELDRLLLSYARHFSVVPVGMVRIVSLADTLRAFTPVLNARLSDWTGTCRLTIEETGETVCCTGSGQGGIAVRPDAPDPDGLTLSRREMVRLLFGPFSDALEADSEQGFLRRLFPLPLYWHALSHV